jgi:hypothetical protein
MVVIAHIPRWNEGVFRQRVVASLRHLVLPRAHGRHRPDELVPCERVDVQNVLSNL